MNFDFLKSIKFIDTAGQRTPVSKNPEGGMLIRVYRDGSVYPSKELVEAHNLHYQPESAEMNGNGYDVVPSWKWGGTDKLTERFVMLGLVSRNEAKIDLFQRSTYDGSGNPIKSVLSQGSVCDELHEACAELGYFTENTKYVDLRVHTDTPVKTEDGIYLLPKVVNRGEHKGKPTYERRENITLFPLSSAFVKEVLPKAKSVEKNEIVTN